MFRINNTTVMNSVFLIFIFMSTDQSADIMSSLSGLGVHVRVNDFSSKTTKRRDMFLK